MDPGKSKTMQLPCQMQDGTSKMSKSAENDLSRINLTDTPESISNKVRLQLFEMVMYARVMES